MGVFNPPRAVARALLGAALLGAALLGLAGCAASPTNPGISPADGSAAAPARLTVELAATPCAAGALALRVQAMTLATAAGGTAFVFGTREQPILLDGEPAIVAREAHVAPGRYRTLHLRLGAGSALAAAGREVPVAGGGEIPVDCELAPASSWILLVKLDSERSLRRDPDGSVWLEPAAALVALAPSEGGAYGAIRGRIVPAGASAIVVLRSSSAAPSCTFPDPGTGDFVVDELPIGVYRVEVSPLEPSLEPRAADGVVVPWNGVRDLGVIDLAPPASAAGGDPDGDVSWAAGEVVGEPVIP